MLICQRVHGIALYYISSQIMTYVIARSYKLQRTKKKQTIFELGASYPTCSSWSDTPRWLRGLSRNVHEQGSTSVVPRGDFLGDEGGIEKVQDYLPMSCFINIFAYQMAANLATYVFRNMFLRISENLIWYMGTVKSGQSQTPQKSKLIRIQHTIYVIYIMYVHSVCT